VRLASRLREFAADGIGRAGNKINAPIRGEFQWPVDGAFGGWRTSQQ
jgi:hypothetical protein